VLIGKNEDDALSRLQHTLLLAALAAELALR